MMASTCCTSCYYICLKGKLAHNFMVSYLMFILSISDMVKKLVTEKIGNFNEIRI